MYGDPVSYYDPKAYEPFWDSQSYVPHETPNPAPFAPLPNHALVSAPIPTQHQSRWTDLQDQYEGNSHHDSRWRNTPDPAYLPPAPSAPPPAIPQGWHPPMEIPLEGNEAKQQESLSLFRQIQNNLLKLYLAKLHQAAQKSPVFRHILQQAGSKAAETLRF